MSNKVCKSVKRLERKYEASEGNKKLKSSIISDHVESEELQKLFVGHWRSSKPVKTDLIEIITSPFKICKLSNLLKNETLISGLKDELKEVKSSRNNMDLYQFRQTEDLANVKSPKIAEFYRTFKSDLAKWMETNTGINLNGKISMSSASYSDTDYLLCHDDNIGDRRIAFILYLSKDWTPEDGGALDVFDTDENGQPKDVVKSLIPEYNSLIFFEVVDNSYHQVAEITSQNKSRVSINGWFHGPLRESNKRRRSELIYEYFEPRHEEVDLVSYVSKIYLYETIVKNIQRTIEKDSFIYLPGFLLPERYETLSVDVKSENIKWEKVGPADLRNYEIAREDTLPETLKEFYDIFKSIHIFHLLKQYTELDLVPETDEMKPRMKIELQRWSCGCYVLINDKEVTQSIDNVDEDTENNGNSTSPDASSRIDKNQKECSERIQPVATEDDETASLNGSPKGSETKKESKSGKGKSKASASSSGTNLCNKDSAPSVSGGIDCSDIEDYLSEDSNSESEISETDGEEKDTKPGTLDVLLQFHTNNATEDATIDYVDPSQKDGALIHIPPQDNHLCLVYRTADTCRCNKYVNHYCKGYFYTLVCSYYE